MRVREERIYLVGFPFSLNFELNVGLLMSVKSIRPASPRSMHFAHSTISSERVMTKLSLSGFPFDNLARGYRRLT